MVGEIYVLFVWSVYCVSCLSGMGVIYMSCLSGLPFFSFYFLHSQCAMYFHVYALLIYEEYWVWLSIHVYTGGMWEGWKMAY